VIKLEVKTNWINEYWINEINENWINALSFVCLGIFSALLYGQFFFIFGKIRLLAIVWHVFHAKWRKNKQVRIRASGVASSIIFLGGRIHIFVFCIINFFWNWLFLRSVNTNIWICPPPPHLSLSSWLRHWYVLYGYELDKKNVSQNRIFSPLCLIKTVHNKRKNN
jgi:hypothetical protein